MENIVRKGEIACSKQFLLFSLCFQPYMALIFHCKCTLKCRLQIVSIWTSLKFCPLVMGYHTNKFFCPSIKVKYILQVPHWVRGEESAIMLEPRYHVLPLLGLGTSIGTGPEGLKADVIVVKNFDELDQRAQEVCLNICSYPLNESYVCHLPHNPEF